MKAHSDECGGASEVGRDAFAAGHRQRRGREKEAPQGAGSVPGSEESVVMEDAEPFRASPSAAASEAGARDTPRKRRVTFSENEDVKIKDPEGTKLAVEDITRLPAALANIGQDDNQHIDADIPMSVIPGDACRRHGTANSHTKMWNSHHCARKGNAKEN